MKNFVFSRSTPGISRILFWIAGTVLVPAQIVHAQSVLGTNLIVNGNAETGSAGTIGGSVVTIPGWTVGGGSPTVLGYNVTGDLQTASNPAPPDHGFQYFGLAVNQASTLTQNIDVSSAAVQISGGNLKFTAGAYLGATTGVGTVPAQMSVAFENAKGQVFNTITVGPGGNNAAGMSQQQQIGLVPAGTVTIAVTLALKQFAVADSLSLVLAPLSTTAASVLGANLVINGNAEAGPSAAADTTTAYVPGWSTDGGASVCPYGGSGSLPTTAPGPVDRGVNLFCGFAGTATDAYQDLDVSAAATQIDAGQINYQVAAWLGAATTGNSPTLTYSFYDWTGKQLAPTAQLGQQFISSPSLVSFSHSDVLPSGTRRVHIELTFPAYYSVADDVSFSIGNLGAPVITPAGLVPVYSSTGTIQPGSWVSIFGTGLASATTTWTGNFPTMLGGTSVTIDSKPAYLWFVSPTQINLQAPDDAATGTVNVVVTTPAGSTTSTVTLGQYAPSFSLYNSKYAAAIVPTVGTPGNSGNGYDYIGPGGGGLPFTSRPVKAGETVLLYGVGFGPTTPPVPAGAPFSGAAPVPVLPAVTIGGVSATVTFAGIVEAGLYQLNVVVPSAGSGDKALLATIGGVTTPANVFITLQ